MRIPFSWKRTSPSFCSDACRSERVDRVLELLELGRRRRRARDRAVAAEVVLAAAAQQLDAVAVAHRGLRGRLLDPDDRADVVARVGVSGGLHVLLDGVADLVVERERRRRLRRIEVRDLAPR